MRPLVRVLLVTDGFLRWSDQDPADADGNHSRDVHLGDFVRHLEDNDLPADQQQKLFGFYVPSDGSSREPNAAYRMIKAYFRNLVYWLIPADRRTQYFWEVLDAIVRSSQLREELADLLASGAIDRIRFEHFLHFGQLAEKYFASARGHCATFEFLIRTPPEIEVPARDWLPDQFDPWDPKWKWRDYKALRREQWLGAIGVAPRTDVVPTLLLGIGVVAAAATYSKRGGDGDGRANEARAATFAKAQRLAFGEYATLLAAGADVQAKFARLATDKARLR